MFSFALGRSTDFGQAGPRTEAQTDVPADGLICTGTPCVTVQGGSPAIKATRDAEER